MTFAENNSNTVRPERRRKAPKSKDKSLTLRLRCAFRAPTLRTNGIFTRYVWLAFFTFFTTLQAEPMHGFSVWGQLKYASDFQHFNYVNPDAPKGGHIHLGSQGSFDSLNPFIVRGASAPGISMTYATLLERVYDEVGTHYAYVAQTIDVSPCHCIVTFTLNPQAKFNNGEPITAADVKFSFEALKTKGRPAFRSYFGDVDKVEILNNHQVRFTLKNSHNRELPLILGEIPILSHKYYAEHNFDETTLTPAPCSGPYEIEKIEPGHSITFRLVSNWWGRDLPTQKGHHNITRISYDTYRDNNTLFESFKAGKIDVHTESTASRWMEGYNFQAVQDGLVKKVEIPSRLPRATYGLFFNTRRPVFEDIRIRQALTLVFDFEWMNKHLFRRLYKRNLSYFPNSDFAQTGVPQGEELNTLEKYRKLLPAELFEKPFTLSIHDNPQVIRDMLEAAGKLLDEAGWKVENGQRVKNDLKLNFEILIYDKTYERFLLPYTNMLKRLGVIATLRLVDAVNYENRVESSNYDMIIGGIPQSESLGNEQRNYWGSKQANAPGTRNFAGIQNPVIDELIEFLIASPTYDALVVRSRALDRVLLWNYYMIPAWHSPVYFVAFWDRFGQPKIAPSYYVGAPIDTWWIDPEHEQKLQSKLDENRTSFWQYFWQKLRGIWGG